MLVVCVVFIRSGGSNPGINPATVRQFSAKGLTLRRLRLFLK
jgi:hypothetical protein